MLTCLCYSCDLQEKLEKEEQEILQEIEDEQDKGELVETVNENTKKVHIYNTKTLRDQYGTLPPWKKPRNTDRKIQKKSHAMKKSFNQAWINRYVPL